MKKGVVLFMLALIFLTIISSALAQEEIKKAYDWLGTKVRTRPLWDERTVREHVFALLALSCNASYKDAGNGSLFAKAWRDPGTPAALSRMCWGEKRATIEAHCLVTETALAKLVADRLGLFNTSSASRWLLNHSIIYRDPDWFVEIDITRGQNASCAIFYNNRVVNFSIAPDKKLFNLSADPCFSIDAAEPWWLRLDEECYEKSFKIKCIVSDASEYRITLRYRKLPDPTWYISARSDLIKSGSVFEFSIQSFCLANPGSTVCDYEALL